MWNLFYWFTGTISFVEGLRRARYFEATDDDGHTGIFMRWPTGCVWRRDPDEEVPPASLNGWFWKPVERLPRNRREISEEEAHAPA